MDRRGFTLIELLIFAAIFTIVMIGFVTMLIAALRVQGRQTSANGVETEGQFLLQEFQYYIQTARLVAMTADVATGTLQLRMSSSSLDPTFITLNGGTVYLQQGSGGAVTPLTSNAVTVSNLSFTRHYNLSGSSTAYGTDSVSYSFTMAANTPNATQLYSQTFESSAALLAPVAKIALVQQANNLFYGTSTSLSATYGTSNATGSLLVAVVANTNLVSVAVNGGTDSAGNAWTQVASETYPAYGTELSIFAATNAKNSSNTVTMNFGGSGAFNPSMLIYEYRGAATSSSFDAKAVAALAASTTLSSGLVSPTSSVELIFGALTMNAAAQVLSTSSYQYTRAIIVTSTTSVASGTNNFFPMLVSSTVATWETTSTVGGAGHVQNLCTAPNGGTEPCDLTFVTSTANCGAGSLNFETESYVSSTGALVDWVNVPTMQAGATIYACYGNQSVVTDQSHPAATWNSGYVGVWHLPNPVGTLSAKDSTLNANNGVISSTVATAGLIDGAASFNPSNNAAGYTQEIVVPTSTSLTLTNALSVSAWIKSNSFGGTNTEFLGDEIYQSSGMAIFDNGTYGPQIIFRNGPTGANCSNGLNNGAKACVAIARSAVNDNNWHYLVGVRTGVNGQQLLYLDGVLAASSNAGATTTPNNNSYTIGSGNEQTLDEVNLSNVALPPSWIATEYSNQKNPSTFYAMGSETALNIYAPANPPTAGTGFTIESSSSINNTFIEDQNLFITGPVAATWTTSPAATSTAIVTTFK